MVIAEAGVMKGNLMLFAAASLMAVAHGSVVLENESMSIGFSSASSGFAVTSIVNRIEGNVRFVDTDRRRKNVRSSG